jgi:UDP-N-acetylmuramoyl-L-alanyl-D-glutamate--2,6-diaminopimelate ligase
MPEGGVPVATFGAGFAGSPGGVRGDSFGTSPGEGGGVSGFGSSGFAAGAAAAGAAAVLTDPAGAELAAGAALPLLVVPDPRAVLGAVAAWVQGEPATKLRMYGVTGTNGKTTTTYLLDAALRRGGRTTGLVGTVETRIGDETLPSVRTTPEATDLQAWLALMVERGVTACSMEVSSHALALHRVDGIVFDVAGFTNLSQDHLDFHPTMGDYFAAKADLFTPARSRCGVVCVDDEWGRRLAADAGVPVTTVATVPDAGPADWVVTDRRPDAPGTRFTLTGPDGVAVAARCPLPGDFNVANTAVALLVLVADGVAPATAAGWLAEARAVPGRMEPVAGTGAPGEPLAVVDYAHTPDALTAALRALRGSGGETTGRLVVVLGAGGDRDRDKRPLMGAAAAAAADVVVVTDDNPRSEDPAAIRAEILAGVAEVDAALRAEVREIGDRRAAIAAALDTAGEGDVVLVAGKGHETGQEVAGVVHPFDDREVVRELMGGRR